MSDPYSRLDHMHGLPFGEPDIGITELDQPDGEAFFNSNGVSHIVVSIADFDTIGDAACVCGEVARHADLYAKYDLCPECAK